MELGDRLKKLGTLGGALQVNKKHMWMYGNTSYMSKEKLFGMRGPLHPGMPVEHELAATAVHSDTKEDLIRELTVQTHLTREEAVKTVNDMLMQGILREVDDPGLGKVLVFRGGK